jgi:hypothetical protein
MERPHKEVTLHLVLDVKSLNQNGYGWKTDNQSGVVFRANVFSRKQNGVLDERQESGRDSGHRFDKSYVCKTTLPLQSCSPPCFTLTLTS